MIVFLSAPIPPLKVHDDIIIKPVTVQVMIAENTGEQVEDIPNASINEAVTFNFENDKALENMNREMAEIESISDQQEWFIAYKEIIEEYSYILDPPKTIYDYFTEDELELLFRVVQSEVGDEYSFDQKVNVATVIFNRLYHERFPNTLLEILTPDQFSPIASGRYKRVDVSEVTILACEYSFQIGSDISKECLFFDSNGQLNYKYVDNDGAHNFYKLRGESIDE